MTETPNVDSLAELLFRVLVICTGHDRWPGLKRAEALIRSCEAAARADERERCAKVCDEHEMTARCWQESTAAVYEVTMGRVMAASDLACDIRALGDS